MTTTTAVESRVITMLTYLLNKRFFIQSSLRSCNKKRKSKSLEPRVSYHQWVNRLRSELKKLNVCGKRLYL